MHRVAVASYMGSGSSAVTDLLRECERVVCPNGSFEYVFLHCPDGVFDLEDKLLRANNALRSDEALRSFRAAMAELDGNPHLWFAGYRERVSSRFMEHVDAFIDELTTVTFPGFWYEQEKVSRSRTRLLNMRVRLGASRSSLYATDLRMSFVTPERFWEAAARFVDRVLSDVERRDGQAGSGQVALYDQLVLPHGLDRIGHYFPDHGLSCVVVSRDPRDVFVLNKYVWAPHGNPVPLPLDVDDFCTYYRAMRDAEPGAGDAAGDVLRVRFEDLVWHYERTRDTILGFVGVPDGAQSRSRELFDPSVSVRNVGLARMSQEAARECETIERRLPDLLYPEMGDIIAARAGDGVEGVF